MNSRPRWLARATALAVATVAMSPAAGTAGTPTPKEGTYSGAGTIVGDPSHGMELGLRLEGVNLEITALLVNFPGCSGGASVPQTTVDEGKFETASFGSNSEVNRLKGRWVKPGKVKGKLVLERPEAASCGDQGTFTYKYSARRYGGP